jgi:serine/threonine protein kinase
MNLINNKYNIEKCINSGSFGNVYKCIYQNKCYAIKEDFDMKILKHEATIYKNLKYINNISNIYDFFIFDNKQYLVLDYYEYDLIRFKYQYNSSESYIYIINKIIIDIIIVLKNIHERGYIHRDIKPNNICLNMNFNIFLIDFGLSKQIIVNNKHIIKKNINNIIGSMNFASINTLDLIEPTRRDDIESLLYVYLYLLLSYDEYKYYDSLDIYTKKNISSIHNILLTNINSHNIINKLITIFNYIRKLNFSQVPNYKYIIDTLKIY